jgi:glycosyltransferase involved in cell wall biosynthesis
MRIGYLTYGLDRALTGIGRYSLELPRALVVLPNAPEIVLLTTEREDMHGLWNEFEHHSLPGCRKLPGLETVGNIIIPLVARNLHLDLVHDPTGVTPFMFGVGRTRTLVTIHDTIPWSFPGVSSRLDTWIYRYWLPLALPHVNGIITISETSKADIIHHLNIRQQKIQVVYRCVSQVYRPADANAIAEVRARYGLPENCILYVGSAEERKNLRRLLHAYARLVQNDSQRQLVIAGPHQPSTSPIGNVIQELDLGQRVTFTGYIRETDLPALYSAAEVFVFPSLYEGFGLPPLEAMACGTPVITSNASSLPEVVGDAALTVDPYDVDGLAAAIERALADEDLRAELRRRGLERAARFTWERAARETLAVYEQVLVADPQQYRRPEPS